MGVLTNITWKLLEFDRDKEKMYCGGGVGEDRERVVITHPPVTRNEQALRSKFLVTATALDLELTEDGQDMGRCEREVR